MSSRSRATRDTAADATSLARYAPARIPDIPAAMAPRTQKVLAVAAAHGQARLVLGAWGCGAFGLDSRLMADSFHRELTTAFRGVFDLVVFAIADWSGEQRFIGPFRERFAGMSDGTRAATTTK